MRKNNLTIGVNSSDEFNAVAMKLANNAKTKDMWERAKLTVEKAFYPSLPQPEKEGGAEFTSKFCNAIAISIAIDDEGKRQQEKDFIYATQLQKQITVEDLDGHLGNL